MAWSKRKKYLPLLVKEIATKEIAIVNIYGEATVGFV